jgi:hypothetical protein
LDHGGNINQESRRSHCISVDPFSPISIPFLASRQDHFIHCATTTIIHEISSFVVIPKIIQLAQCHSLHTCFNSQQFCQYFIAYACLWKASYILRHLFTLIESRARTRYYVVLKCSTCGFSPEDQLKHAWSLSNSSQVVHILGQLGASLNTPEVFARQPTIASSKRDVRS